MRRLDLREPVEASFSDIIALPLYLSQRIKAEFEPWKLLRSNLMADIEPASSHKLGMELPRVNWLWSPFWHILCIGPFYKDHLISLLYANYIDPCSERGTLSADSFATKL
ncbi:hypothetical protein TNCV_3159431 [Trichonephila clavipes]|nr:hypothetical protein TNCV_3159431 [Trichonephila clavipes]